MPEEKDDIYKYQPLWGKWYIELPIGKGSFGSVYKIGREDMGKKYISAVKIISVPTEEQYRDAEASFGNDEATLSSYFEDIVKNIVSEIDILYTLSGNTNIISYHDHEIIKRQGELGWDILIRMEYVTSIRNYLRQHQMTRQEIIKLGIDICSALDTCSKKGIIHRDIKDENIFINEDGVFKLGDFGIARELSKSGRAASMRGTPLYMAPEIFRGEKYDVKVDIYSLGIVLYRLLNNGRMPFMPDYPLEIKFSDNEAALEKRMTGTALPSPARSGEKLGEVVLKACSYRSEDRYQTPEEMRFALEAALASLNADERNEALTPPVQDLKGHEGVNQASQTTPPTEKLGQVYVSRSIPNPSSSFQEIKKQQSSDSTISIFSSTVRDTVSEEGHAEKDMPEQVLAEDEKGKKIGTAATVAGVFLLIVTAVWGIYRNIYYAGTLTVVFACVSVIAASAGLIGALYAKRNGFTGRLISIVASLIIIIGVLAYGIK